MLLLKLRSRLGEKQLLNDPLPEESPIIQITLGMQISMKVWFGFRPRNSSSPVH